ncbi:juvenile hormone esterase-like [Maniola hyperantus]|uniref:juvenile hormone esterase-like n=1 Tax=Aphantopus hyperantus TaxID=2795564 RepID=UPI0015696E83|nr:juvenile hormone esterase-like [Maniola hyperantus]
MAKVTISQGTLRGSKVRTDRDVDYYEFLSVPYAKPPVGDLRFKSPQPPESWEGERDATSIDENNICCQIDVKKGVQQGSEDCLYLHVYTPRLPNSDTELLPVMFFIHGGGFVYSNGIVKEELGPDYLIENGVVVVTINYRLGVFGFLQLGIPEAAGNMGLKDQVQALKWVQNNIDKFGGDRDNVTLFGISAGSASVEYLILSPLAKGLFHKAILQSGSTLNHWAINFEPKKIILKLIDLLGYNGNTEDNRAIHEFLLKIPASQIVEPCYKLIRDYSHRDSFFCGFVPTIEKEFGNNESFVSENPYKMLKEGRFNIVPVIKGFCSREGYLTSAFNPNASRNLIETKNLIQFWGYEMEASDKQKWESSLLAAYTENIQPDDEIDKIAVDFFGDFDFVAGIWLSGKIMANLGLPVYFYELCYDGNINFFKHYIGIKRRGTAHGDDLAYIFKHTITKFADEKDIAVRAKMTKLWANFAKTSVPTCDDTSVEWPAFNENSPVYISIDEDITIKSNYEPKKMAIFKEIYEKYEK